MLLNKNNSIYSFLIPFISGIIVGFFISYFIFKKDVETVKVPVKIRVPIPTIKKEFDTIKLPGETIKLPGKIIIDSLYFKQYLNLKDSIAKNDAYKDAITIREYNLPFEDDTILVNTYSKVRGTLLEMQVDYETKARNIEVDTTIDVKVPKQAELYMGGKLILPTDFVTVDSPSIAPAILLVNKKHSKSYNVSYDFINKVAEIGLYFRF